jgi:hypothetical protein
MGAREASRELGESKKDFVVFIPFQMKTIKEILFPRIKRIVEMEVNILLKGNWEMFNCSSREWAKPNFDETNTSRTVV